MADAQEPAGEYISTDKLEIKKFKIVLTSLLAAQDLLFHPLESPVLR
jgi:hypothetical protein